MQLIFSLPNPFFMLNILEIFWQNSASISENKSGGKRCWFSQCLKHMDNNNKNNCQVLLSRGFSGPMFQSSTLTFIAMRDMLFTKAMKIYQVLINSVLLEQFELAMYISNYVHFLKFN